MTSPLRKVTDVVELLELADITDVRFLKVAGVARESPLEEFEEWPTSIRVLVRNFNDGVSVRCILRAETPDGRYEVDAAGDYAFSEPLEPTQEALAEFVSRVAVMAVYPYLREALHQTAAKLRLAVPTLGLLRAGSLVMSEEAPYEINGVGFDDGSTESKD